jgi:hypothetical protein
LGKVIKFHPSGAGSTDKAPVREFAIEDPQRKALEKIARKLEAYVFRSPAERETIARNWHHLLQRLKSEFGIRKEAVYQVLQKESTSDEAQKRSQQYEIRPHHSGANLERRKRNIIQKGSRWLKLVESAAKHTGKEKHHWLLSLLEGTSLAPDSTSPTVDTAQPVTALLDLAKIVCARIAEEFDLASYFDRWDRLWVGYRHHDQTFVAGRWLDRDGDGEEAMSSISSGFYMIGEEGMKVGWHGTLPLPSAPFAEQIRLGRLKANASIYKNGKWTEWEREDLEISYVRQFRLAVAMSELDRSIAPVIEIRDNIMVEGAIPDQSLLFRPYVGEFLYDVVEVLSEAEQSSDGDGGLITGYVGRGKLITPDGPISCELWFETNRSAVDDLRDELARIDADFDCEFELSTHYYLLSPRNAERLLSATCFPIATGQQKIESLLGVTEAHTLNNPYSGLGRLEKALLDTNSPNGLFTLLHGSAQELVAKFNREYLVINQQVHDAHQRALQQYRLDSD